MPFLTDWCISVVKLKTVAEKSRCKHFCRERVPPSWANTNGHNSNGLRTVKTLPESMLTNHWGPVVRSISFHRRAIWQEMPKTWSREIHLDIVTYLCSHFPVWVSELTHCGLVTPYGNKDLGQHGSGNGLVPDGSKPLPEPMLTDHQWSSVTFISGQFHKRCLNHQSLKSILKLHIWNFFQISQGSVS